jgi:hypothetical protein
MLGNASAMFAPLLEPDERLIWSGQPRGGIRFELSDIFVIPFSLLWASLAFGFGFAAWQPGGPIFIKLWSLPFIGVGIYIVAGRFVYDALLRKNTHYALTDRRAIILTDFLFRKLQSIDVVSFDPLTIEVGRSGVGKISFGVVPDTNTSIFSRGLFNNNQNPPPSFSALDNAQSVYELIRQIQRSRMYSGNPVPEISVT